MWDDMQMYGREHILKCVDMALCLIRYVCMQTSLVLLYSFHHYSFPVVQPTPLSGTLPSFTLSIHFCIHENVVGVDGHSKNYYNVSIPLIKLAVVRFNLQEP